MAIAEIVPTTAPEDAPARLRCRHSAHVCAWKEAPAIIAGADFAKLLAQLQEPYRTMVSLIAATGLRIGEPLAL